MDQIPTKVVVTSQPTAVVKVTNQPQPKIPNISWQNVIPGVTYLKDLKDVSANLTYINSYVLAWNSSSNSFVLIPQISANVFGSNVYSLTFKTNPNSALTVNNALSLTTTGNATIILATNTASIGGVGVVSLNDTLSSANIQQAATANVANALNTNLTAIGLYAQSSFALANIANAYAQNAYAEANTTNNIINPANGVIIIGNSANSRGMMSQISYANGSFANTGDASYASFILRNTSTNPSYVMNLSLNGANSTINSYSSINQITLGSNNYVYSFSGYVTARDTNNNVKVWHLEGAVKRGLGAQTTSYVGTPIINIVAADNGTNNWTAGLSIDSINAAMIITGTGSTNRTNWVSKIDIIEVG